MIEVQFLVLAYLDLLPGSRADGTDPHLERLVVRLLEQAGVAATPGLDFGSHRPREHMRFSYTVGRAEIAEGLNRLGNWLSAR